MDCQIKDHYCIIDFGVYLNRENLLHQKEIFINALTEKKSFIFQAEKINQIDTVSLQLLLCFIHAVKENNLSWHWQNPSRVLLKATKILGIQELLKLTCKT